MAIHYIHPDSIELLPSASCWGAQRNNLPQFDEAAPPTAPILASVPRSPRAEEEALEALLGVGGVCLPLDTTVNLPQEQEQDLQLLRQQPQSETHPAQQPCASALPCYTPSETAGFSFTFEQLSSSFGGFQFYNPSLSTVEDYESLKRIRHGLDVDGPNTAALGCKKRRLRVDLITSPLSQAYSQPATHILNREGQKHGDRRFFNMSTASVRASLKRQGNVRSTAFMRYSAMNRAKKRMQPALAARKVQQERAASENANDGSSRMLDQEQWKPQSLTMVSRSQFPTQLASAPACNVSPATAPSPSANPIGTVPLAPIPSYHVLPSQQDPSLFNNGASSSSSGFNMDTSYIPPIQSPEPPSDPSAYDEFDDVDNSIFGREAGYGEEDQNEEGYGGKGKEPMYPGTKIEFGTTPTEEDKLFEEYIDKMDGIPPWRYDYP